MAAACASLHVSDRLDSRGRITKSKRAVRATSRWNKSGDNCEVEVFTAMHEGGWLICRSNKQGAGVGSNKDESSRDGTNQ